MKLKILILSLAVAMCLPTVAHAESKSVTVYTTDTVKARYHKSDSKHVKKIKAGTKLVRVKNNKKWDRVRYKGKYYYVNDKYLSRNKAKLQPHEFIRAGVVTYDGYTWTWYSQKVLPGGGLVIPGRHVDEHGFVCDKNNYICLASNSIPKHKVISTPFSKKGKIYDSGCKGVDVYCDW